MANNKKEVSVTGTGANAVAPKTDGNTPANISQSERFMQEVIKQYTDNAGEVQITNLQRRLGKNYFVKIDQTLKDLEKKRLAKDEKWRDPLEFAWKNVNLQKLAVDVVAYSAVGLDPLQPNQLNFIPYSNKHTGKFDIGFIIGYRGLEIKNRKYGMEVPSEIVVELVYKTDTFKLHKKDMNNKLETYEFVINNEFERGELIGGFYYHSYHDAPQKNKARVFSKADIEKRKPDTASAEFWGGEKDKWVFDKEKKKNVKQGKETVEGWYDEMAWKTIFRAAWNAIAVDAEKIDDHYVATLEKERELLDDKVRLEIKTNANNLHEVVQFTETTTEEQSELPTGQQLQEGSDAEREEEETTGEDEQQQEPAVEPNTTGTLQFDQAADNGGKATTRKPGF